MSIFRKKSNFFDNEKIQENFKKYNLSVDYDKKLDGYIISTMDKYGISHNLVTVDDDGKFHGQNIKLEDSNSIFYDYANTVQHIKNNNGFLKNDWYEKEKTDVKFYGDSFNLETKSKYVFVKHSVFQPDNDNIRKYDVNIVTNGGLPGYRLKLPLLIDKNNDITLIDKLETGLAPMDKELWLMKKKIVSEKISKESQVVLDEPFVQEKFNECNIEYEYNRTTDNYDLYSCKLDYKDEKYKIISCDRKGKVGGYDLYLQDEDSEFYNYVEDLQTIKSDSKYKNFNFEFNAERAAKVRELTKPSNAVVEDEDANEDDAELSIKQACFENIIRKMTEQNNGMER